MQRAVSLAAASLAALGVLIASGCSTHLGDLTIASTKNVALNSEPVQRNVEGKDCVHFLLFVPLGKATPTYDDAMSDALEQVDGANIMTDVSIYMDPLPLLLYNRSCLRVEGDVGILQ